MRSEGYTYFQTAGVAVELRRSVAVNGPGGIVLELCGSESRGGPRRMVNDDPKMYCFCTAEMPIRAILAISEDVVGAK